MFLNQKQYFLNELAVISKSIPDYNDALLLDLQKELISLKQKIDLTLEMIDFNLDNEFIKELNDAIDENTFD